MMPLKPVRIIRGIPYREPVPRKFQPRHRQSPAHRRTRTPMRFRYLHPQQLSHLPRRRRSRYHPRPRKHGHKPAHCPRRQRGLPRPVTTPHRHLLVPHQRSQYLCLFLPRVYPQYRAAKRHGVFPQPLLPPHSRTLSFFSNRRCTCPAHSSSPSPSSSAFSAFSAFSARSIFSIAAARFVTVSPCRLSRNTFRLSPHTSITFLNISPCRNTA